MDRAPGSWYVRACSALSKKKDDAQPRLEKEKRRHMAAMQELRAGQRANGHSGIEKRIDAEVRRHEKEKRRILQPSFNEATYYLGMDVSPSQAVGLAAFSAMAAFVVVILVCVFAQRMWPELDDFLSTYILPLALALPVGLFGFLSSYPEILAKRMQAVSLGRTSQSINYMTMSLRTSPSLERAVAFASEHCDEPVSSHLKKVLWEVYMRKYATVEESLSSFAYRCGQWNDDLKNSLYVIRGAGLEQSQEGYERSLEKAHNIALSGSREKMLEFASKLSGPSTVLFALGVVLPLLVGAMIPMQGLQMPTYSGSMTAAEAGGGGMLLPLVFGMDIAFPLLTLLFAYTVLGKRPGTGVPPSVEGKNDAGVFAMAVVAGAVPLLAFMFQDRIFPGSSLLPAMLPLLSASLFVGVYLLCYSGEAFQERKRILAVEKDLPDALFQIGSRIAEGKPLEAAFSLVAETMDNSPISPLFMEISNRLKISHDTPEGVLFGREGVVTHHRSRVLRATMRSLMEAVKKDNATAGRTMIETSGYLKDLQRADKDIKAQLQGVVDMMRTTSMFFAPLVMGITVAMYSMLSEQFSSMSGGSMISTPSFAMILGVYLAMSTIVTSYFVTGIWGGGDKVGLARSIGTGLPISVGLFILAAVGGQAFIV